MEVKFQETSRVTDEKHQLISKVVNSRVDDIEKKEYDLQSGLVKMLIKSYKI